MYKVWTARQPDRTDQMALEQFLQESVTLNGCSKEGSSVQKWNSVSEQTVLDDSSSGGFDCNICLDFVQDPVVTLCGHLFCWPCIYKWLHFQRVSSDYSDRKQPQCPVCKADVTDTTLVPLYGRGTTSTSCKGNASNIGLVIPRRPSGPAFWNISGASSTVNPWSAQQVPEHNFRQHPQQYHVSPSSFLAPPIVSLGGTTIANTLHPILLMLGDMVNAGIISNTMSNRNNHLNSYHLAGDSSPRVRRNMMQADKSLGRLSFFLFCCLVLCFILF